MLSAKGAEYGLHRSVFNSAQKFSKIVCSRIDAAPATCPVPEPSMFLSSVDRTFGFLGISFGLHPFFLRCL